MSRYRIDVRKNHDSLYFSTAWSWRIVDKKTGMHYGGTAVTKRGAVRKAFRRVALFKAGAVGWKTVDNDPYAGESTT